MSPCVSVLVPTLDEVSTVTAALDRLAALRGRFEVLVVDGGSQDATVALAREHAGVARILTSPPLPRGRAAQLNAAAREAGGEVLLFLHADTVLPPDAYESLAAAVVDEGLVGGNFALAFDGGDGFARFLGRLARALRRVGVYYGDSAIFVRTSVFEALGGFRELAVMEDYDFARRLERLGRTACLPGPAVTSGRRWRSLGARRTLASWTILQAGFALRVPTRHLAKLYRSAR
jgi:rSAM/selenodomain-associated transferase 2